MNRWPDNLGDKQEKVAAKQERTKEQFEWYRKLHQDGFEDLETFDWRTGEPRTDTLKKPQIMSRAYRSPVEDVPGPAYYELAHEWLHTRDWSGSDYNRKVWELHCAGTTTVQIARAIGAERMQTQRKLARLRAEFVAWTQGWRMSPVALASQREETDE
jgi:hypothetical protein